ncbi:MAG TPA: polymorphic toxin type 23 domain-containing protein [Tenuifilaceae bacterium]|nr:polymorphic toxin type 23 domain-containing protein [Tenuifilaceae bacterium]
MKKYILQYILLGLITLLFNSNLRSQINTNLPVGSLSGSYSVNQNGAVTYSIPIEIPAGKGGLTPQISLVYNSQGGDGILGVGWSISGTSSIARTPQTYVHDGLSYGITLTSNDRFSLDGNRLMLTSTGVAYGADGATYGTELETFSRITSYGSPEPYWFKVETKDGRDLFYGINEDARLRTHGVWKIFNWLLSRIDDKRGNQIFFYYNNGYGEASLDRIEYSGIQVRFNYETRPDQNKFFIAGGELKQSQRLISLEINVAGTKLKEYKFTYVEGNKSKLYSVTEFGRNGEQLNPTIIDWGAVKPSFSESNSFLVESGRSKRYYFGDFNGDGRCDFILTSGKSEVGATHDKWDLYLANYDGTYYTKQTGGTLNSDFKGFYVTDVNNDGKMDALMRKSVKYTYCCIPCESGGTFPIEQAIGSGNDVEVILEERASSEEKMIVLPPDDPDPNCCQAYCSYNRESFFFYTYNGTSMVRGSQSYDIVLENSPTDIIMYTGQDFDGDGKSDYLILDKNKNYKSLRLSSSYVQAPPSFNTPNSVDFLDFNGDGATDIMLIKDGNCKILSVNNLTRKLDVIYESGFPTKWHRIFLGDFNGDAKTDILSYTYTGDKTWRISFSNGTGFAWPYVEDLPLLKKDPEKDDLDNNVYVQDLNNDGKDDILEVYSNFVNGIASEATYNYFINNGNGFFTKESLVTGLSSHKNNVSFFDRDGDGIVDLLDRQGFLNEPFKTIFFHKEESTNLVSSITDGFGRKLSITYNTLPKISGSSYTSEIGLAFPLMNFNGALNVVTNTSSSYTGLETTSINYKYTAAIIHRQGKGFLGFKKFTQTNQLTGLSSSTEIEIMPTVFLPMVKKVDVTLGAQSVSSTLNTNIIKNLGNKRFFTYIEKQSITDALKGITNTVTHTYDSENCGNITKIETQYGNDLKETVVNTYTKVEAWCNSKLQTATITRTRTKPASSHTANYTYSYYANGLLQSKNGMGLTKTFAYDSYGNITCQSTSGTGVTGVRKVSYKYNSTGRNVEEYSDEANAVTRYTVDPITGLTLKKTLPNTKTISYEYDGFGRLIKEISPTGVTTTYGLEWDSSTSKALTKSKVKVGTMPEASTWFDAYGRVVKTQNPGFNGDLLTTTTYNFKGQKQSVTKPYYSGESTKTTNYEYDSFGRVVKETIEGLVTNYTYDGNTTIVKSPQGETVTKTDALGNVIESKVNEQLVYNTYNAMGKVIEIRPQWGASVKMEYDNNGFQTKLIDPSAGTNTFQYNALGELLEETNAKNEKCSITYDNFGRIVTKSWPGFSLTYQYHSSGGGVGNVKQIAAGNIIETYEYDSYGRLDSVMMSGVGTGSYSYKYTFDSYGNTTNIRYPGGLTVNQAYRNGYLEEIKTATGDAIWKASSMNSSGMVTESIYGTNVSQLNSFDKYGFPTSIKTTALGSLVQQFDYGFDVAKGNLSWRRDVKHGLTESFGYDGLNRLTSSTPSNTGIASNYTFVENGNITTKSGIGEYEYTNTANVYALTGVTGELATIQPEAQGITYTPYNQPKEIINGDWKAIFEYGPDLNRREMKQYQGETLKETWIYFGGFEEKRLPSGEIYQHCYISSPNGQVALFRKKNSENYTPYFILKDHLGSITALLNTSGGIEQEYSYDSWGRPRNPIDWSYNGLVLNTYTNRGYTFHEHLSNVGLVNMNGRLYDPLLGRMLSPDNHVQASGLAQNFNRYSYAMNNPLVFTDPSGEFLALPFMALVTITETLSNAINGYGFDPIKSFNTATNTASAISNCARVPLGSSFSIGLDPLNFGISLNHTFKEDGMFSTSSSFGINPFGFYYSTSMVIELGDAQLGFGLGGGNNTTSFGISAKYNGYGLGYYQTAYGGANSQLVGGINVYLNNVSIRLENDFLAFKGEDRWRSNALEVSVGNFSIGTHLFNNDPKGECNGDINDCVDLSNAFRTRKGIFGTWKIGKTYSSPLYLGYRFGNSYSRIGYSHPIFQNITQNFTHRHGFLGLPFGYQNLYKDYSSFQYGLYVDGGYYNPYSIWGK